MLSRVATTSATEWRKFMSEDQVPPQRNPPPPPSGVPPTPPPPAPPGAAASPPGSTSDNRTVMIVLSYLWILALIPLLTEKEDREVQWHAKHGLVLTGVEFLLLIVLIAFNVVVSFVLQSSCLASILYFLFVLVWIGILVFHVLCILKANQDQRMTVPYVSEFADKF